MPSLSPLQDILPNTANKVDKILDDEIIATGNGETRRYMVRWKGKAPINDSWIDPAAVERYKSISTLDSTGSSLLPHGENDGDIHHDVGSYITCLLYTSPSPRDS